VTEFEEFIDPKKSCGGTATTLEFFTLKTRRIIIYKILLKKLLEIKTSFLIESNIILKVVNGILVWLK
jgi:hypothetical protein